MLSKQLGFQDLGRRYKVGSKPHMRMLTRATASDVSCDLQAVVAGVVPGAVAAASREQKEHIWIL